MAELEMKDFIPKEVIEAPLKLERNMKEMLGTLDDIINKSKQQATALDKAHSTTEIKKMVDALTKEQVELKKVNLELERQIIALKAGHDAQAKQIAQLEDIEGALNDVSGGLGGTINRIKELTKAALVFIATPLGLVIAAIGAALFALMAYFRGSEEGQNRLNKIVKVGQAIFEQFMNVVEDLGEAIYDAFSDPQQALKDFGQLLLDQVWNRIKGIFLLLPRLGEAISEAFAGNFKKAGQIAFDAVSQIGTGVENMSEKIANGIKKINEIVDAGIIAGNKIADLEAEYDRSSRDLLVKRAETEARVQKIREEAAALEGEARKNALLEAIRLEKELGAEEVKHAELNLALQKQLLKTNGDDKDALMAVAEAQAAVADARARSYKDVVRFAREIAAIDRKMYDDQLKALERITKLVDRQLEGSNKIISIKQTEADAINRFGERLAKETEERQKGETMTEEEQSNLRRRIREQELGELIEESGELLDQIGNAYGYFADTISNIFGLATDARLEQIDREEEQTSASYERQIEMAGENVERRTQLENQLAAKKAELERRRREESRKSAVFEKFRMIAEAIMQTAKTVIEFGIVTPLAIAAGIAGGILVGKIASTKIPSYSKGTKKHSGGLARVGEEGSELLLFPDDRVHLSPDGPAIMDLPPGTAVVPHKDSMKFLAIAGLTPARSANKDITIPLGRYFQELNHTIKNKKETHYNWTARGLERAFQNGESRRYFKDHFYR